MGEGINPTTSLSEALRGTLKLIREAQEAEKSSYRRHNAAERERAGRGV